MPSTVQQPPSQQPLAPTPWSWRLGLFALCLAAASLALIAGESLGPRGRAACGLVCFLSLVAGLSRNLRQVSLRTLGVGLGLQVLLGLFILRFEFTLSGVTCRPGYALFDSIGWVINRLLDFSLEGAKFVFGSLVDTERSGFIFAFRAMPTVIFISSFFTVLYHFGVLQVVVRVMSWVVVRLMGTSGAETLSATANVFMGQTEAPLIVKPYVARMTESELLALMVGGMATISGGIMGGLLSLFPVEQREQIAVALLTTSVMAAPAGLYLSKLLVPETQESLTRGQVRMEAQSPHTNAIDAAAAGASDGMKLVLNIIAMLIAFIAFIALADALLAPLGTSLRAVFATLFYPVAVLLGVEASDAQPVAALLGTKLALNEFVAFLELTKPETLASLSPRGQLLAAYALTGFANFASIGIQLGGIGAIAPERRADLARLGGWALFLGFLTTLVNATIVGILLD
jgi:CNT family concentrative nucleoside transporter